MKKGTHPLVAAGTHYDIVVRGMTSSSEIDEAEVPKVLMQDYISARQEILLHLQLYKTVPIRNAAILIAVVGLLVPVLSGQSITVPVVGVMFKPTAWNALGILFAISTIGHLLIFSVLAILFNIQVLGERCFDLENQINNSLRGPYLIWEHFASQIWATDSKIVYKMPDALAALFFYVLVLIFTVGLCGLVLLRMRCGIPAEWFSEPDTWLEHAQFAFAVYLLAVPAISIYVNIYTYGSLRPYCRDLLEKARAGSVTPSKRSDLWSLIGIAGAAGVLAYALLLNLPQRPNFCAHIGSHPTKAVSKAALGQYARRLTLADFRFDYEVMDKEARATAQIRNSKSDQRSATERL